MRLDLPRPRVWVALAIASVTPGLSMSAEAAREDAREAASTQAKLEVLARVLPNGPDLSAGLEQLHRSFEKAAGTAALAVEGLAAHAGAPVVSGDTGYVPVELRAMLRSKGPNDERNGGYGLAPWIVVEGYLRESARLGIFERLQWQAETDGSLRFSGLLRLHFWTRGNRGLSARELLQAKVSAIVALRTQVWWPLRRLAAVAYTKVEPDVLLSTLTLTSTELSAQGIAPWPVSAREWFPLRELEVSSLEWSQQGSCQRFAVKARFPKPDVGAEPPPKSSPKDLALLLARPDEVCRAEAPSTRRLPFVKFSGNGPLTVRARGLDLLDVVLLLHRISGRFVIVDEHVAGRASLDLTGVTLEQGLAALVPFGVSASPPALIRHVSFGKPAAPLALPPGREQPVAFTFKRGDFLDILRLLEDLTGDRVLVPPGPFPRVSIYAAEVPFDLIYDAVLSTASLNLRREPGLVYVERQGVPGGWAGLPPRSGYRRQFSFSNVSGDQMEFSALSSTGGGAWTAWMLTPQGLLEDYKVGTRLWDGTVRSVDEKGVVIEINVTDPLSAERTRTRRLELAPPDH